MMIEQNTSYAYKLKYIKNPSFDKIRGLTKFFINDLPKELADKLYEELDRGIDILDSEPHMLAYLYAYGIMHQAKLNHAFNHLSDEFLKHPEIDIIDYGCGQALGTMCYIDYLKSKNINQKIKRVTLIEPSELCLKRAALHVSLFCPDAEIITINKSFDNLNDDDISISDNDITLHILSNVLDILDFDLVNFTCLIKRVLRGFNIYVCIDPYFGYPDRDNRLSLFVNKLNGKELYHKAFDKYEFDQTKALTAQIAIIEKENLTISEVFDKYLRLAKQGHAVAQCMLGLCYSRGDGVTKDNKKAYDWYKKAAEQGYAIAQHLLGVCYYFGLGVSKDSEKAIEWYTRAAKQEYAKAQYDLANCMGALKDYNAAAQWYDKAAQQGLAEAQFKLGVCYYNGLGVTQNYEKAYYWYKKAAEQGDIRSQINCGYCFEVGCGINKDLEKAIEWYEKAANQGSAKAQFNLALCYSKKGVLQNWGKVVEWSTKSANQGFAGAQYILGICYMNGLGVAKDLDKSAELFLKAAEQGYKKAIEALKTKE